MYKVKTESIERAIDELTVVKKACEIEKDYEEESRIKDIIYELQDIKSRLENRG